MSRAERGSCPPFEELSAWHDGESAKELIDRHLGSCPECSETLDQLTALDKERPPEADAATLARIRLGTQTRLKTEPELVALPLPKAPPLFSLALLVRLAAVVALGILIFQLNRNLGVAETQLTKHLEIVPQINTPLSEPSATFIANSAAASEEPVVEVFPPAAGVPKRSGTLHSAVGVQFASSNGLRAGATAGAMLPEQASGVALRVQHLWVSDNAATTLAKLGTLLPREQDRAAIAAAATIEKDQYSLRFVASDRELQEIVNTLSESGASLFSPGAPQPGGDPTGQTLTGRSVLYQVDFVRR